MAKSLMDLATTFLFFTLLITTTNASHPSCASSSKPDAFHLSIFHIFGDCSPLPDRRPEPWPDTVLNMASKVDPKRVAYLNSLVAQKTSAPIASGPQVLNIGNYLVQAKIGTPAQPMFMVLDTSYSAAWVPSSGCLGCTSPNTFSPTSSSTFGPLDCSSAQCSRISGLMCSTTTGPGPCLFNQSYGGDSSILATLSQDSLTLGNDVISKYAFGCISAVSGNSIPPQGLLGLGRGSLSLLSQSTSLYKGVFSYCLPSYKSYYFSGSLKLGPAGQPRRIRTTPLLQNPYRPSLYYVNLTAVSVGRVRVPIPQEYLGFDPNTGTGTIIDTGTVLTRLVGPAYYAIRDEFRSQVEGPFIQKGVFDTCFTVKQEQVGPRVTLHFEGMDLKLPMENTLIHSSVGSVACLGMASNGNSGLNIIASLQQQNLRILFDTANSRLGISPELCN